MKNEIKHILKLFLLFEFLILVNSFALKAYEHIRFYQFDLDNDYMFSEAESLLDTFEIWSLKFYSDVGENLLIIFSPIISIFLALICFAIFIPLKKLLLFQKLSGKKIARFNKKNIIVSSGIFVLIGIIFFVSYLNSSLSKNSILKINDYLILILCSLFIFFFTIIIDDFLSKFFNYKILINIFFILLVIKTFSDILFDIISLHTDSFLYLLLPISAFIPELEAIIEIIKSKKSNAVDINEKTVNT